ncbi:hypothetical protein BSL78_22867 [Apostichopus japonicus]|uniref:Uncharacterized protein n=1 Tax=Stichopus japonicus TaxID=307972 RepID=A0A2G8JX48_STIJA|nr:hypothetical protein BSL78_22867 [Apostichopus japonicus]
MLLYLATFAGLSNGVFISGVTDARWNGIVAYFSVPRARIAAKLAEIQSSSSSCDAGGLTLPYPPVLQDLIGDEDHVVAVSFGRLEATSAHTEDLLDSYATEADTVQFFIPFLTGKDETAEPMYKLALNSFVSTDKPFFQPNVAIPTEQVESISLSDTGLVVRNGSDVLSISFTVPSSKIVVFLISSLKKKSRDTTENIRSLILLNLIRLCVVRAAQRIYTSVLSVNCLACVSFGITVNFKSVTSVRHFWTQFLISLKTSVSYQVMRGLQSSVSQTLVTSELWLNHHAFSCLFD